MITDEQRHQLFTKAQDVFGREEAAIFMEAINPISIAELATKADFSGLKADFLGLKEDVAGLKEDVAGLDHRMDLMEMRLDSRMDKLTADLQRTFVTWLLTSQTTVVVAVALMLSLR